MRTAIVIPSFRGAKRVRYLLDSIARYDRDAHTNNVFHVFEDPSDDESTKTYRKILDPMKNVIFQKLDKWSNMHGAAIKAVATLDRKVYDWFLYLGDDLLATPCALSNVLYFLEANALERVSLVQIPYWNAHDFTPSGGEWKGLQLLNTKDDMYSLDLDWLLKVPRNKHWDDNGVARPYINVNGAGFACKLSTYDKVDGFAGGTWCLDESISVRTWLESDQSIVTVPGPPFVHYFGGATSCDPPFHDQHTEEAWISAMGMTKKYADMVCRMKLEERKESVMAEMSSASYYDAQEA